MKPKFKIGDRIKVIKYGHAESDFKKGDYDMLPQIVGKRGIITKIEIRNNYCAYAIDGIPEKHAWYDQRQLIYSSILMRVVRFFW